MADRTLRGVDAFPHSEQPWVGERPSLAYHCAFDLCGAQASHVGGPTAVWASSLLYARELVRRLRGAVLLRFTREPALDERRLHVAMGPEVDWGRVRLDSRPSAHPSLGTVLWAEPERRTWQIVLSDIQHLAPCAVRICVVGTTWLRQVLPEWRTKAARPARAPTGCVRDLVTALHRLGYVAERTVGFHGPASLFWGALSRVPAALGRDDLVDRCFAAMREAFVVNGWQAGWAPVWVISAQHSAGQSGQAPAQL